MSKQKRTVTVKTRVLNSDQVVETGSSALSPAEKRLHGLKRARQYTKERIDTSHLRWV
jgi:hypothetical protein